MEYYVLFVSPGREIDVRNTLFSLNIEALVPRENRLIRQRGLWINKEYTLFPCYVFIGLEQMSDSIYYKIKSIPHVKRFLGISAPEAISNEEAKRIGLLAPTNEALPPSVIEFDKYGTPHIISGVLRKIKPISYDKHRRRALVDLSFGKIKHKAEFSFTLAKKVKRKKD